MKINKFPSPAEKVAEQKATDAKTDEEIQICSDVKIKRRYKFC